MKPYRAPHLDRLGSMARVTRKSGDLFDWPDIEEGRATGQCPDWLCDWLPGLPCCN